MPIGTSLLHVQRGVITQPEKTLRNTGVHASIFEADHHFIGMHDIQLTTQQFPNHIRVSMVGVEQLHLIGEHIPILFKRSKLSFALIKQTQVLAPRKQTRRPSHGQATHDKQAQQCAALR